MPGERAAGRGRRWRLVRARRDVVPASVRRMNRAPGRSGLASGTGRPVWRRPVAVVVVVVLTLGAIAWVLLGTSAFGVRQVKVVGAEIAAADAVRAAAAVAPGTPLARVDTGAVSRRVRALPPVAAVAVRRAWPHTLVIEVTERTPVAVVARDGSYQVLDASGVIFDSVRERPGGLVLLRLAAPGPQDPTTRAALRVVGALTPALRERVTVLVADAPHRLRLELTGAVVVVWGDAENSDRKAQVATSLLGDASGKTIDVSAPDVATVS